jgi:hypothetical protein
LPSEFTLIVTPRQIVAFLVKEGADLLMDLVRDGPFAEESALTSCFQSNDAGAEIARIDSLFCNGTPQPTFWTFALLSEIDEIAQTIFKNKTDEIGTVTDSYLSALSKYTERAIAAIESSQEHHPLLKRVVSRLRWATWNRDNRPPPLPLMTASVIEWMVGALSHFPRAIMEVSLSLHTNDFGNQSPTFRCPDGSSRSSVIISTSSEWIVGSMHPQS